MAPAAQDALVQAVSNFEEGLQKLAYEVLADVNRQVAGALDHAFSLFDPGSQTKVLAWGRGAKTREDFRTFAAGLPPLPTGMMATRFPPGVQLPPPRIRIKNVGGHPGGDVRTLDPTLEPSPEVVATGWRWCDGTGKKLRHMWNLHTTALALFPRPSRRKEMSLPVERCRWHQPVPGPQVVADIVAKAKAKMKASR